MSQTQLLTTVPAVAYPPRSSRDLAVEAHGTSLFQATEGAPAQGQALLNSVALAARVSHMQVLSLRCIFYSRSSFSFSCYGCDCDGDCDSSCNIFGGSCDSSCDTGASADHTRAPLCSTLTLPCHYCLVKSL